MMEKRRCIHKLMAVFDVINNGIPELKERKSIRIRLEYDKEKQIKRFTLLDKGIPADIDGKIRDWLHKHVNHEDLAYGLWDRHIDAAKLICP